MKIINISRRIEDKMQAPKRKFSDKRRINDEISDTI